MNECTRRGDSQVGKEKGRCQLLATTPGPPQASIRTSSAVQPDTSAVLCPRRSREYGRVSCKLGLFPPEADLIVHMLDAAYVGRISEQEIRLQLAI